MAELLEIIDFAISEKVEDLKQMEEDLNKYRLEHPFARKITSLEKRIEKQKAIIKGMNIVRNIVLNS